MPETYGRATAAQAFGDASSAPGRSPARPQAVARTEPPDERPHPRRLAGMSLDQIRVVEEEAVEALREEAGCHAPGDEVAVAGPGGVRVPLPPVGPPVEPGGLRRLAP